MVYKGNLKESTWTPEVSKVSSVWMFWATVLRYFDVIKGMSRLVSPLCASCVTFKAVLLSCLRPSLHTFRPLVSFRWMRGLALENAG